MVHCTHQRSLSPSHSGFIDCGVAGFGGNTTIVAPVSAHPDVPLLSPASSPAGIKINDSIIEIHDGTKL